MPARRTPPEPARDFSALERLDAPALEDDTEWFDCMVDGATFTGANAGPVRLADVFLHAVDLRDAVLDRLDARDCLVSECDLANSAWAGALLTWVEVAGSRATGLDLSESVLKHVTFRDCKLDLAGFRFAHATDVAFRDCALIGADLTGAELTRVTFERCDLTGADLSAARLEEVDLRTSTLESLRGVGALRGATVDATQLVALAPSLATALGIVVHSGDDG